jgi:hypothetical protein
MPTLQTELNAAQVFARHELTHVLHIMYTIVNHALQADADTLRFDAGQIVWSKADAEQGRFDASMIPTPEAFHDALTRMRDRDPQVRDHVQPIDAATYRIM